MRGIGRRLKALEARTAGGPAGEQLQPLAIALDLPTHSVATEAVQVAALLREQGYDAVVLGMVREFACSPHDVLLTVARVEEAASRWCGFVPPPRSAHGQKGMEHVATLAAVAVAARELTAWKSWALPVVRWQAAWVELAAADPAGRVNLDAFVQHLAEREPFSAGELRAMLVMADPPVRRRDQSEPGDATCSEDVRNGKLCVHPNYKD